MLQFIYKFKKWIEFHIRCDIIQRHKYTKHTERKSDFMTNDMTKGNPVKLILSFMIPLLIGNLFQQFYNMADTIIVGRTISVEALAAVGATGSLTFMIIGFAQGFTSGFAVITAQHFGAGDEKAVRNSVAVSIILSAAITVVLTAASLFAARPLLEIMQTPSDIIDDSYSYISVIFAGIFASVCFNFFSAVIRAFGDSKTPLLFLIIACVINIILDFVFILAFNMGVAGAGFATVLAQIISCILCFIYSLKKFPLLRLKKEDWYFRKISAKRHLASGLPMGFQFSITALGALILQSALNTLGTTAVASFTAASKIDQFAVQPLASIGVAVATFVAQNYGAGRLDRVKDGVKKSALISVVCALLFAGITITFSNPLLTLFVGSGQDEVVSLAKEYLIINGSMYIVLGLLFVYRNALQGIGKGITAFFGGVWELAMRSAVAILLVPYFHFTAASVAGPTAWIAAAIWFIIMWYCNVKKLNKTF